MLLWKKSLSLRWNDRWAINEWQHDHFKNDTGWEYWEDFEDYYDVDDNAEECGE